MKPVRVVMALVVGLTLAACAIPHQRDDTGASKLAIEEAGVDAVYARYREVYNAAVDIDSAQPLSVVERGSVLDIDTAAFQVEGGAVRTTLRADEVAIPRFKAYPLWFMAVASTEDGAERRVQVFSRMSSVDTWTLVASPRIVAEATLPKLRASGDANALAVAPDDDRGMVLSPQAAVDAYVASLSALPEAAGDDVAGDDAFLQQMRDAFAQNQQLADVEFSQAWGADPVEHAIRTSDGGALVFATLHRADQFQVTPGRSVTYPDGTVQRALAPEGIVGSGTVRFDHQVLLLVPPGNGEIRVLGQFGGVVAVE
ncbi:MAG: hypothetical protein P1U38_05025 [Aeromicrobium sp.]|uniref:hypothetical protein n=1 Tax=Aeromicrobium sp. TaxID=1871063 RepID=UPI002606389C|nr:hypothetical protein [Aeromicrobium sp.]MDF1704116.1 hypothetical protein [Aeromicrobium sp.]